MVVKQLIQSAVNRMGYTIVRTRPRQIPDPYPSDIPPADRAILMRVAPYTMTTVERQMALVAAVRYIARNRVPGDIVECGVWRGGSMMATALTLLEERDAERHLYLFDTFEGMSEPTELDRAPDGTLAKICLDREEKGEGVWCYAGLEEVQANMAQTIYPPEKVHFVKGMVEATIPQHAPKGPIALLRLDTDWYESTKHELEHLYGQLVSGGVLIIDDYGHWEGARKAVDEFFAMQPRVLLSRIDYTGRMLVKP